MRSRSELDEPRETVKYGLPRTIACQMAAQAVLGSAKMVLETGKHPEQLKAYQQAGIDRLVIGL